MSLPGYKEKYNITDFNLDEWIKLGDIKYKDDKLNIIYSCYRDLRKDPFGRLYLIVTEGEIVKIGGDF